MYQYCAIIAAEILVHSLTLPNSNPSNQRGIFDLGLHTGTFPV